jgi:hypothetical protein
MYRIGADLTRQSDDRGRVQVALGRRRRPDPIGLVGQQYRQTGAIGIRVDDGTPNAQVAQTSDDANRDLAAVRHQHLLDRLRHGAFRQSGNISAGEGGRRSG